MKLIIPPFHDKELQKAAIKYIANRPDFGIQIRISIVLFIILIAVAICAVL